MTRLLTILVLAPVLGWVGCDSAKGSQPQPSPGSRQAASLPAQAFSTDWYRHVAQYWIAVDRFQDSDADGIGDLAGLTSRLPQIASLGVGAVVLDPVMMTSPDDGHRAPLDFRKIDPRLGTDDDFSELLTTASSLGLRTILTVPVNHVGLQHPWFVDAQEPDSDRRDWFRFRDNPPADDCPDLGFVEGDPYSGSRWSFSESAGAWYFHRFATGSPDLDLRNFEVVNRIEAIVRYWLDSGIDGLVLPHPYAWIEADDQCDNTQSSRDLLTQLRSVVDGYPGRVLLAMPYHPARTANDDAPLRQFRYLESDGGSRGHLAWSYGLTKLLGDLLSGQGDPAVLAEYVTNLDSRFETSTGLPILVTGHPDLRRFSLAAASSEPLIKFGLAYMLTQPFPLAIQYGDELGMGPGPDKIVDFRDFNTPPMAWTSSAPTFGFSDGDPQLAHANGSDMINFDFQDRDEGSILQTFRQLLGLRNQLAAFHDGRRIDLGVQPRFSDNVASITAWRVGTSVTAAVVVHNLSEQPAEIVVDVTEVEWPNGSSIGDYLDPELSLEPFAGGQNATLELQMAGYQSRILARTAATDTTSP